MPWSFLALEQLSDLTAVEAGSFFLPLLWPREKVKRFVCSMGGRVVRWSWVNFQGRGVLLLWVIVGQGPIALAVGAGGGCLDIFTLNYPFFLLSPSLWETARCRLKYRLKGRLNLKQPTNHRLQQARKTSHFSTRKIVHHLLCLQQVRATFFSLSPHNLTIYFPVSW